MKKSMMSVMCVCVLACQTGCPEPYEGYPYSEHDYHGGSDSCLNRTLDDETFREQSAVLMTRVFQGEHERRVISRSSYTEEGGHSIKVDFVVDPSSLSQTQNAVQPFCSYDDSSFYYSGDLKVELWHTAEDGTRELLEVILDERVASVRHDVNDKEMTAYQGNIYMWSEDERDSNIQPMTHSLGYRINWAIIKGEFILSDVYIYEYGDYVDFIEDYFIAAHPEYGGP